MYLQRRRGGALLFGELITPLVLIVRISRPTSHRNSGSSGLGFRDLGFLNLGVRDFWFGDLGFRDLGFRDIGLKDVWLKDDVGFKDLRV